MNDHEKFDYINSESFRVGGNGVVQDNVGGWLNHYKMHFVGYHYCAAIYRSDLFNKMDGGFNELFKDGIGADDDEFIKRLIYNKFNFKIAEFGKNNPFVIHQYHHKDARSAKNNNLELFKQRCIEMEFKPENNIEIAPIKETPIYYRNTINRRFLSL